MNTHKRLSLFAGLIAAAMTLMLVAAACGGGETADAEAGTEDAEAGTETGGEVTESDGLHESRGLGGVV